MAGKTTTARRETTGDEGRGTDGARASGWGRGAGGRPAARGMTRAVLLLIAVLFALAAPQAALAAESAPKVSKQPVAATAEEGSAASFTAAATGTPVPTVQWERSTNAGVSWSTIPGATAATYTIAATTLAESGYQFRAVFTNKLGSATTGAVALTVRKAPSVTAQPQGATVNEGQTAIFEAAAAGTPAPTVQWQTSATGATWANVAGATSTTLSVVATSALQGHQYRAVFTNAAGAATSEAATLHVNIKPAVTLQPVSVSVEAGSLASFTVGASGTPHPGVQWERSTDGGATWSALAGQNAETLTIASATTAESGYQFRAVFTNAAGAATSSAATLSVHVAPAVTKQPVTTYVVAGHAATFEAAASGFPAPTVQWQQKLPTGATFTNIAGATSPTLTLNSVTTAFEGREYRAVFTNAGGSATTEAAVLHVDVAPGVSKQPVSTTVEAGSPATFVVVLTGVPTPSVQWERSTNAGVSWSPLEGATSTTLTIPSTSVSETGYLIRAVATNAAGSVTTSAATLTVQSPPQVTEQPQSVTVEEPAPASFHAAATGSPAPTVQWETSANGGTWTAVAGATSPTLVIAASKTTESGHYFRAKFSNAAGKATSEAAILTVQKAPAITKQPVSIKVEAGNPASFTAAASGFPAPTVQWQRSTDGGASWSNIEGATSATLTIPSPVIAEDGYRFRAVFTNVAGTATTAAAILTVHEPPAVTLQPQNQIVVVGETATFTTEGTGYPAPTVQWQVSTNSGSTWTAISGATSPTLTLLNPQLSESGRQYRAVYTNSEGSATSVGAVLTVASTKFAAVGWGTNLGRQLGNGTVNAQSNVPSPVVGLKFVTEVSAGGDHGMALLADGTVQDWGSNRFGQLDDGTTLPKNVPVKAQGLAGVRQISAGGGHSLARLANGTVMAWGANDSGQLGNGTTTPEEAPEEARPPTLVKGLTGVKEVAAGTSFSLALLNNGTVMSWGNNESGQLGNGKITASNLPVAVKGLTGVTAIAAGEDFALALLSNGTVEAWGSNAYGQLGNAGVEELFSSTPVPVEGLSGVAKIVAGANHGLALTTAGAVMAWGANGSGQLGSGVFSTRNEKPQAVGGLSGVTSIEAGGVDSAALLGSGQVMTWGANASGTLGIGSAGAPSAVPVTVVGIGKVANVSVGAGFMLAYGEPIPTVSSLSPNFGSASGGTEVTIHGASLTGATAVHFGAAAATSVTAVSAETVTAVAPAGAGTVDVTVSTPAGTSPPVVADRFTYVAPPTVTKIKPNTGPITGGTSVTITGAEFQHVTGVAFAGVPAAGYTVVSPTTITALAPPGAAAGYAHVTVSNVGGTSAAVLGDRFRYTPVVESLSPAKGPAAGGTTVTITGQGFSTTPKAVIVKFGLAKATGGVTCSSTTSCTATAPPGAIGSVHVIVTVEHANSSPLAADLYTYE